MSWHEIVLKLHEYDEIGLGLTLVDFNQAKQNVRTHMFTFGTCKSQMGSFVLSSINSTHKLFDVYYLS